MDEIKAIQDSIISTANSRFERINFELNKINESKKNDPLAKVQKLINENNKKFETSINQILKKMNKFHDGKVIDDHFSKINLRIDGLSDRIIDVNNKHKDLLKKIEAVELRFAELDDMTIDVNDVENNFMTKKQVEKKLDELKIKILELTEDKQTYIKSNKFNDLHNELIELKSSLIIKKDMENVHGRIDSVEDNVSKRLDIMYKDFDSIDENLSETMKLKKSFITKNQYNDLRKEIKLIVGGLKDVQNLKTKIEKLNNEIEKHKDDAIILKKTAEKLSKETQGKHFEKLDQDNNQRKKENIKPTTKEKQTNPEDKKEKKGILDSIVDFFIDEDNDEDNKDNTEKNDENKKDHLKLNDMNNKDHIKINNKNNKNKAEIKDISKKVITEKDKKSNKLGSKKVEPKKKEPKKKVPKKKPNKIKPNKPKSIKEKSNKAENIKENANKTKPIRKKLNKTETIKEKSNKVKAIKVKPNQKKSEDKQDTTNNNSDSSKKKTTKKQQKKGKYKPTKKETLNYMKIDDIDSDLYY